MTENVKVTHKVGGRKKSPNAFLVQIHIMKTS